MFLSIAQNLTVFFHSFNGFFRDPQQYVQWRQQNWYCLGQYLYRVRGTATYRTKGNLQISRKCRFVYVACQLSLLQKNFGYICKNYQFSDTTSWLTEQKRRAHNIYTSSAILRAWENFIQKSELLSPTTRKHAEVFLYSVRYFWSVLT
jgi:hypothetical protein